MSKRFTSILLILIILFSNISTFVFAEDYYENRELNEWDEVYLVDPYKEWTISFNEEISENSVDNTSVYVKNHLGEIIDTNAYIGRDKKTIIVEPPNDGYSSEYDYTLYIENIYSIDGKILEEDIKMNFFVDDGINREEVEYQEDIVELEDIIAYVDEKEIIMNKKEFERKELEVNSIIIIEPTAEDMYGYSGKIISISEDEDGENVNLKTVEPSLEEVFAYIDIKGEQEISIEQMMNIPLKEDIMAREYREYDVETEEYTEGVEYIFGSKSGDIANVGIKYGDFIIKGSIRIANPKIDFDINKPLFRDIDKFYLSYNADILSNLEIEYSKSFSGDLDESVTLFSYPVPLGPTGLIADFKLDVYAEGDINASGKMEAEVSQTTRITLGARKARNGKMEWVRNTTKEMPEFTSYIETEFKANAEAGINPSIELSFFKIASANLQGKIGPYLKLDAKAYGRGNFIDGYFSGKLYTEVGVAFSSEIKFGVAFGIVDKTHFLGRVEVKIWNQTSEYNAETYGELQNIKFSVDNVEMKVNETRKLEIIGVYENTVTGNTFESPIIAGIKFSLSPPDSASIDNRGNIKILSDEYKEIIVTAIYKGKEASMVVNVERKGQGEEPNIIWLEGDYNSLGVFSDGLAPVSKWYEGKLKWGYVDKIGKEVIPLIL